MDAEGVYPTSDASSGEHILKNDAPPLTLDEAEERLESLDNALGRQALLLKNPHFLKHATQDGKRRVSESVCTLSRLISQARKDVEVGEIIELLESAESG